MQFLKNEAQTHFANKIYIYNLVKDVYFAAFGHFAGYIPRQIGNIYNGAVKFKIKAL